MTRIHITTTLVCCVILLSGTRLFAQDAALQQLRVDLIYLASDDLEGRATGSPGETLAAQYIASRFESLGLSPKGVDGGWFQSFSFTHSDNPHAAPGTGETRTGRNVIGYIDNGADRTVVIGAHYDHLGYGGRGSLYVGDPMIHNGADDNASGTTAMLEIARQLKASPARGNNYLLMAFSGEELGLFGSKYFVNNPTISLDEINYMINLDMVGRLNEEKALVISGTGTSPAWSSLLDTIEAEGFKLSRHESGVGASDHTSFYLKDIPSLHFFTGQHKEYHKPADDSYLINYEGIQAVAGAVVDIVEGLDTEGELAFTKTSDADESRQAASFKVTLGVMPDYTYEGEGLKIDAVQDGRPAANAGLEGGDLVLELGPVKIKDIYAYMEALSTFEKGQTVKAVVKRGDSIIEKDVTF
jgi:hypothetical protein